MVKLSRIVKKIVAKGGPSTAAPQAKKAGVESYASRGKSQPTIDFSNLPSLEELKRLKDSTAASQQDARHKKLVRVKKARKLKPAATKHTHDKFRSKILGREGKAGGDPAPKPALKLSQPELDRKPADTGDVKAASLKTKLKAVKKDGPLSRGQRKRELKKEAWRKKFEFREQAKRIIDQFKKEDKFGKALGNLEGIKGQLDRMEDSIKAAGEGEHAPAKRRPKLSKKALLKSRRMFNIATQNV